MHMASLLHTHTRLFQYGFFCIVRVLSCVFVLANCSHSNVLLTRASPANSTLKYIKKRHTSARFCTVLHSSGVPWFLMFIPLWMIWATQTCYSSVGSMCVCWWDSWCWCWWSAHVCMYSLYIRNVCMCVRCVGLVREAAGRNVGTSGAFWWVRYSSPIV